MKLAATTRIGAAARWLGLVALLLALRLAGAAQVFHLVGGMSTLYNAQGGTLGFQGPNYDGSLGAGLINNRLRWSALVKTELSGYKLGLGDDAINTSVPTDIFNSGHFFHARGLEVGKTFAKFKVFAFAGASSSRFGSSLFQGAEMDTPTGALFLDDQISSKLRLFSRTLISAEQTSINGVSWKAREWLTTAVGAGIGSGQGYFSSSVVADKQWISAKAQFATMGSRFRRLITEQQMLGTELDRENFLVTVKPKPRMSFGMGRQNALQLDSAGAVLHATVNDWFGAADVARFRLGGNVYDSVVAGQHSVGLSLHAGRTFAGRIETTGAWYQNRADESEVSTISGTVKEIINSRFSLLQVLSHSAGQTNLSLGGNLTLKRIALGLEYQTVYLPFRTGGSSFAQVAAANARIRLFRSMELNGNTYVSPDGKLRYTVSLGGFFYRYDGLQARSPRPVTEFARYLVWGKVTDEDWQPIAGAAVQVDGVLAYTDHEGRFFVRLRKKKAYSFRVLPTEFLTPSAYEVLEAPTTVQADVEENAPEVKVVVHRVRRLSHSTQWMIGPRRN